MLYLFVVIIFSIKNIFFTFLSLRGPRGAMIFYRKGSRKVVAKKEIFYDLQSKIDSAVFPGHQGGPHNHTIGALAVALKQAQTPEFKEYQQQVLKNCKRMADSLLSKKYSLVSGGTDNHLVLVDLRSKDIDGSRVEFLLEMVNIYVNKNTVPGDKSALVPSGLRLGSPAMTTRGLVEEDFDRIVEFLDRGVNITKRLKNESRAAGGVKLFEFKKFVLNNGVNDKEVKELKAEVTAFANKFDFLY